MISSTFGEPGCGATRGGHQGLEFTALSLITPPKDGGVGGRCRPSMVMVALGLPGTPWIMPWVVAPGAAAGCAAALRANHEPPNAAASADFAVEKNNCRRFMPNTPRLL